MNERAGTKAWGRDTFNSWDDVDNAFKAWAEQFAKRLDELGACPAVTARQRCHVPSPSWASQEGRPSMKASSKRLLAAAIPIALAATVAGVAPASAQEKKPNILFIMGDDIGWMQPSIYHRGLMVGETPNIDRIGQRRRDVHGLRRRCRAAPPGATPSSPACIRCAPA